MAIRRRNFLRSAGTMALGRLAGLGAKKQEQPPAEAFSHIGIGGARHKIRVALLRDAKFPTRDAKPLTGKYLEEILEPFQLVEFDTDAAAEALSPHTADVYFHPYGSAIPSNFVPVLHNFLKTGGNWMQLGGIPCSIPMEKPGEEWVCPEGMSLAPSWLPFVAAMEVGGRSIRKWGISKNLDHVLSPPRIKKGTLWNLHLRDESLRHVEAKPLLNGMDRDGAMPVRPIQQFDWKSGPFCGGRWVIASCSTHFQPEEVQALIKLAAFGAIRLNAELLTVDRREVVEVRLEGPEGLAARYLPAKCVMRMWNISADETAYMSDSFMALTGLNATARFQIPRAIDLTTPATAEATFELDRTPLGRLTARVEVNPPMRIAGKK